MIDYKNLEFIQSWCGKNLFTYETYSNKHNKSCFKTSEEETACEIRRRRKQKIKTWHTKYSIENKTYIARNCLLNHATEGNIEGKVEVRGRRGRRLKQLLDKLKEKRKYWNFKKYKIPLYGDLVFEEVTDVLSTDYKLNGVQSWSLSNLHQRSMFRTGRKVP
jgi:hypothetical protein